MENTEIIKKSGIHINVSLDKENLPTRIQWKAEDSGLEDEQEAKAMILSFWDGLQQNALRIDLWAKEMNLFLFQTIATLGDTYERATNNSEMANEIRDFANFFGKKTNVFDNTQK